MDKKSKQIYEKIEHFLEERKGRERRDPEQEAIAEAIEPVVQEGNDRRKHQDRRTSAN